MVVAPRKLGARARKVLERVERGDGSVVLCAPVVAEVLLLRGLGRVALGLADVRECLANAPGLRFAAGLYNLFNQTYHDPGGFEHVQDRLRQDGFTFRVQLSYGF